MTIITLRISALALALAASPVAFAQEVPVVSTTTTSESSSGAISGSASDAQSISDQAQIQAQSSQQGNAQSITFNNSAGHKRSYVGTNTAVPLAASVSFSSDYCSGTVSTGASAAPIGISIGGSGPVADKTCQALRRSEKFGVAAANAFNMGYKDLAGKLLTMQVYELCMADNNASRNRRRDRDHASHSSTENGCERLGLLGSATAPGKGPEYPVENPAPYENKVDPRATVNTTNSSAEYLDSHPKVPRN